MHRASSGSIVLPAPLPALGGAAGGPAACASDAAYAGVEPTKDAEATPLNPDRAVNITVPKTNSSEPGRRRSGDPRPMTPRTRTDTFVASLQTRAERAAHNALIGRYPRHVKLSTEDDNLLRPRCAGWLRTSKTSTRRTR